MGAKCRSKPEMSRILGEKFDLSTFDYRNCNFDGKKRKGNLSSLTCFFFQFTGVGLFLFVLDLP